MAAVLDAIDHSLRLAVAVRNRYLRAWVHSPNAESYAALDLAQHQLDAKLEQRFNAQ